MRSYWKEAGEVVAPLIKIEQKKYEKHGIYPNIPLLRKQVEWVEAQNALPMPEREWDQDDYVHNSNATSDHCGTAFCVAGKIAYDLIGDEVFNSHPAEIANMAQEELRIGDKARLALFSGSNTAADIREIAELIAGGPL